MAERSDLYDIDRGLGDLSGADSTFRYLSFSNESAQELLEEVRQGIEMADGAAEELRALIEDELKEAEQEEKREEEKREAWYGAASSWSTAS